MRIAFRKPWFVAVAVVLGASTLGQSGAADPKNREERHEERKERREERKERRDDLKDEWKEKHKAWVDKREERRKVWRDEVRKKWGDVLERPAARQELRIHAERMARLERIRFLADANGKPDIVARTDKAIERERARHETRMAVIKTEVVK